MEMEVSAERIAKLIEKMGPKHIMLSYNWDVQELVIKVYEYLNNRNIPVWMDIKGGLYGQINAQMAKAVEESVVICPFMTEKYESSQSCEQELNYAKVRNVMIVPCLTQASASSGGKYMASSWLGILTAGFMWISFTDPSQVERSSHQLIREICLKILGPDSGDGKPATRTRSAGAPPSNTAPGGGTLTTETKYNLSRPLVEGDEIKAFFKYNDNPDTSKKFTLNIFGDGGSIILHVDFRVNEDVVVMNSKLGGSWGAERRPKYPSFKKGEVFELVVTAQKSCFDVVLNYKGQIEIDSFPYRCPLSSATSVNVTGDIQTVYWTKLELPGRSNVVDEVMFKQSYQVPGGVVIGDKYISYGTYKDPKQKFSVNIMDSSLSIYLLHFDLRANEDCIVMNSKKGAWGEEIRVPWPNLSIGDDIKIAVEVKQGGYHIKINSLDSIMFPHRIDITSGMVVRYVGLDACVKWNKLEMNPGNKIVYESLPPRFKLFRPVNIGQQYIIPDEVVASGDIFIAEGTYTSPSAKFSFNIVDRTGSIYLLHIDLRANEGCIVMNSKKGAWDEEIRVPWPNLSIGDDIKIAVEVKQGGYHIKVNSLDNVMFPHRIDFTSGMSIKFTGSDDCVQWKKLEINP